MERLCIGACPKQANKCEQSYAPHEGLDELVNDLAEQNRHEGYRHRSIAPKERLPARRPAGGKIRQRCQRSAASGSEGAKPEKGQGH